MPPTLPFFVPRQKKLYHFCKAATFPPCAPNVRPRTWNVRQFHGEVDFRRWGIRLGSAPTFSWSVLFVLLIKDSDFWGEMEGEIKNLCCTYSPRSYFIGNRSRVLWSNCQTNKLTLFPCVDHILFEVWTPGKIFDSSCRFTQQPSQASQMKVAVDLT